MSKIFSPLNVTEPEVGPEAQDHLAKRRLAAAGLADEAEGLALADVEVTPSTARTDRPLTPSRPPRISKCLTTSWTLTRTPAPGRRRAGAARGWRGGRGRRQGGSRRPGRQRRAGRHRLGGGASVRRSFRGQASLRGLGPRLRSRDRCPAPGDRRPARASSGRHGASRRLRCPPG